MKIPPTGQSVANGKATESADRARTQTTSAKASAPGAGSDSVQLSSTSAHLQSIASTLGGPEFDQAKVEEIKQAIRNGTLSINPEAVADKMLASVHEWMTNNRA